jgi:hypothetical protein
MNKRTGYLGAEQLGIEECNYTSPTIINYYEPN